MLLKCSNIQNTVRMSGGYCSVPTTRAPVNVFWSQLELFVMLIENVAFATDDSKRECTMFMPMSSSSPSRQSGPGSTPTLLEVVRVTTDGGSRELLNSRARRTLMAAHRLHATSSRFVRPRAPRSRNLSSNGCAKPPPPSTIRRTKQRRHGRQSVAAAQRWPTIGRSDPVSDTRLV